MVHCLCTGSLVVKESANALHRETDVLRVIADFTVMPVGTEILAGEGTVSEAKLGKNVKQGRAVALGEMAGQTVFPHSHFYVTGKEVTSIPFSFLEGLLLLEHSCFSENIKIK